MGWHITILFVLIPFALLTDHIRDVLLLDALDFPSRSDWPRHR